MIYVRCPKYSVAVTTAMIFGKHYGQVNVNTRKPTVKAGDHTFIFVWDKKKYPNEIPLKTFMDKYFDIKKGEKK